MTMIVVSNESTRNGRRWASPRTTANGPFPCATPSISLDGSRATTSFVWENSREKRPVRSEEHTSELQSRPHLVCRLLLEKKKKHHIRRPPTKKKKTEET